MKNISKNIVSNPYVSIDNSSGFLFLINKILENSNENLRLKEKTYFHVMIKYPNKWPKNLDLFKYIPKKAISNIRKKRCYFIFDASKEGFSPFEHNWFDILYHSCKTHDIDPNQIIFVSSNLEDENNIKKYCKDQNEKSINVFTLSAFECLYRFESKIENLLTKSIDQTTKNFKDKYFSSLSRINRPHRTLGTFLLCQSSFKNRALISHNKLNHDKSFIDDITQNTSYTYKHILRWKKTLPLVVDFDDFHNNWAGDLRKFVHIHNQTIFQIVNETLVDNFNNTSLFYSEKTFRPIFCFQPFLIYGQQGCNRYLKNLGYKTYEDWFDLSFDDESNYVQRYQKLLSVVEDTCKYLNSLTREQQINWKFKNLDILRHNAETMHSQKYTLEKLENFLLELGN